MSRSSGLDAEKIEANQEERTTNVHRLDSLNLLIFTALLVIVVLTIWVFKRRNFRYLHETCLALFYGIRKFFNKIVELFFCSKVLLLEQFFVIQVQQIQKIKH